MNLLAQLANIDPLESLHAAWHRSSPVAVVATGAAGFTGYLASVNWSAGLAFVCIAVPMLTGAVAQAIGQVRRSRLDFEIYKAKALAAAAAVPAQPGTGVTVAAPDRPEGEGAGH